VEQKQRERGEGIMQELRRFEAFRRDLLPLQEDRGAHYKDDFAMKMHFTDIRAFGAYTFRALTKISLPRKNSSAAGRLARLLDTKRPRFEGTILNSND
jgi:hypothetical protein